MLTADIRLTRSGRAMKLVHSDGSGPTVTADASIARVLAQAHRYWRVLLTERLNVSELANREGISASYLTRVLRLAFLSPRVTDALLAGRQRAGVDAGRLLCDDVGSVTWSQQAAMVLPN